MADRRSEREAERIHAILEALSQGVDASNLESHVEKFEQDNYGDQTETRVMRMLTKLDYIDGLALTGKWSKDDHKGRDIALRVTNPHSGRDQIVYVQVKSSFERIAEFRQVVKRKFSLNADHEIDHFLKQEKLIVVNGREPEDAVVSSFETQLNAIFLHHAADENSRRGLI